MLQCIFCVSYLVSRRAEIDRTEFWASCAETNTWTLFVLRCLFSNHNLIHLLTWNGVVLCYAIFLFFCCAMQNNHLMKVWASIRRLMLLHPTANEKIHYSNAGLHIYFLMTKPKQKCKLKANITLWENLHGGAKTVKGHLFTFMSFQTFIIFFSSYVRAALFNTIRMVGYQKVIKVLHSNVALYPMPSKVMQ